jgi:hypothetical protein
VAKNSHRMEDHTWLLEKRKDEEIIVESYFRKDLFTVPETREHILAGNPLLSGAKETKYQLHSNIIKVVDLEYSSKIMYKKKENICIR